ncbi:MAG: hypothetical protein AAB649_05465 [Patescibacteria group bacterium]
MGGLKSLLRRNIFAFVVLVAVAILLFSLVEFSNTVSAQDIDTRVFSCNPVFIPTGVNNTFEIKRGKQISFACAIKNNGASPLQVLLTGKQVKAGGGSTEEAVAISISETISPGKRQVLPMEFSPVFEGGTYSFSFSIKNESTGGRIGDEISFGSILSAQEALINSARLNSNNYVLGEKIIVTIPVSLQNGTSTPQDFVFDVILTDKNGKELAVIAKDQPILAGTDKYSFVLPKEGNYDGAFVRVLLKKQNGELVDAKNFPVMISVKTGTDKKSFVFIMIPLAVLIAGYFIWRRNRSGGMIEEKTLS